MIDHREPLYPECKWLSFEEKLFHTSAVRKLKLIAHFGGASLISPLAHSRFEHTLGVSKLVARFFPEDKELRAASVLFDVAALPFSPSINTVLDFEHEPIFADTLLSDDIQEVLRAENLDWLVIKDLALNSSILHGTNDRVGLIDLDKAFRTLYMLGKLKESATDYLTHCTCDGAGVHFNDDMEKALTSIFEKAEEILSNKETAAVEAIVLEAIQCDWAENGDEKETYLGLTDWEILCLLKTSPSPRAQFLIQSLLHQPDKFVIREKATGAGIPFSTHSAFKVFPRVKAKHINYEVIDFSTIAETI
ncbi:hypothetical protein MM326_00210 [Alkalihalobacillus sp. LMS6]|uniref:hypothetical protein n=1 Tax=Alkalihalobacillus sp. LMS6 TaxID=2924034 RepID=UPI0020D0DEB6|nr:hypothetical protein [Alkalihalobacillus sp. LMS6]UTR06521.1 hypothetical protein MM326_00210 [Alkalihalobacillus sp. LMS6]